jgi:hypothetical protein
MCEAILPKTYYPTMFQDVDDNRLDRVSGMPLHRLVKARNEIERIERLAWLRRFLRIWNYDLEHSERHHNMLCNIYCRYNDKQGLPQQGVEENIDYLVNYYVTDPIKLQCIGRQHRVTDTKAAQMEQMVWLRRFIDLWEQCSSCYGAVVQKDKHHIMLCKIYEAYLSKHNLPKESADEVLCYLQHQYYDNGEPI